MKSHEKATRRPRGYLMLDLDIKPTTDDQQRPKTNVLPGEVPQGDTAAVMTRYMQKRSYLQFPVLNAIYNAEKRMCDILKTQQLTGDQKCNLHFNHLNRFMGV